MQRPSTKIQNYVKLSRSTGICISKKLDLSTIAVSSAEKTIISSETILKRRVHEIQNRFSKFKEKTTANGIEN